MNKQEALLYAVVAHSTYLNACSDKNFCMTAKFENKGTDTQGLFGEAFDNTFVIAFRGSEETGPADWITDLKFVLTAPPFAVDEPSAKVHFGFVEAYRSVRQAVLDAAEKTPHKKIVCTGHSLGGALATLATLDIRLHVPGKQVCCYTYGSPKVGNSAFATLFDKHVAEAYRFVNNVDIVPTMPLGGYEHVGQLCHVADSGGAVAGFLNRIVNKLEDHLPHNYIRAIRDNL